MHSNINVVKCLGDISCEVLDDLYEYTSLGMLTIVSYLNDQPSCVLIWAADRGHESIVKYAMDHGADIDAFNCEALACASYNGYESIVRYLVDNGANDEDGNALGCAAERGHISIMKYLVENGANIDAAFKGYGSIPPIVRFFLNGQSLQKKCTHT